MRSLQLDLPDGMYEEAQRAAEAGGFPNIGAYVADLIAQDTENIDHLFTPERLAIIDRADAEIEAGRFRTTDQVEERLAATRAEWLKANPS